MRILLLSKAVFLKQSQYFKFGIIALVISTFCPALLFAEGSKDFRDYPGKRLWLDTRDDQQLKVFVSDGEFINLGASHVGISGGRIEVYRPDSSLAMIFTNFGNTGIGVINDEEEEINGPTGGGTTNGDGYIPAVVNSDMTGVWTVKMVFDQYQIANYPLLDNSDPWDRDPDQDPAIRVILAWDITVSQGAAGNMGGNMVEGRVYSNEYISIVNGNDNATSPEFIVLSRDGYQYRVIFEDTDPFRFPLSSNSLGLTRGDQSPIYLSKPEDDYRRSDDPDSWAIHPDSLYLYEPQARDFNNIINNKIFFNEPDPNMPASAMTTDIFRGDTHTTWLYTEAQALQLNSLSFTGEDPDGGGCITPFLQFDEGGWFVFDINLGGFASLQLDMNNNGVFDDAVDVTISGNVNAPLDSLFWDGKDNQGNPFGMVGDTLDLNYQGFIRFGEIHISMTDVENNVGGVTFQLLNPPPGVPVDTFFYDHSDLGGPVSGGGTAGNALPTTTPFVYGPNLTFGEDFGNNNYLDQWIFTDFQIPPQVNTVIVVEDCTCVDDTTPVIELISNSTVNVCEGEEVTLSATNSVPGAGTITYTWSGPDGFFAEQTIGAGDTSSVTIPVAENSDSGVYTINASNQDNCMADPVDITLTVNPVPNIVPGATVFPVCEGLNLDLNASNTNPGIGNVTYTWTGPNFFFTGMSTGDGTYPATINGVTMDQNGTYTLTVETDQGCSSSVEVEVSVNPVPAISDLSGGGSFCEGESTTLSGSNAVVGIDEITFTWTGPNGFFVTETTSNVAGPFTTTINDLALNNTGGYVLTLTTDDGCVEASDSVFITVNALPSIVNAMGDEVCAGNSLMLTASNSTPGLDSITYTWTGPNFTFTNTVGANDPFDAEVTNTTLGDSGDYTLTLVSNDGCASLPQTVTGTVFDNPIIIELTPSQAVCEGGDITLSGSNNGIGMTSITYTWSGPNGVLATETTNDIDGPFQTTLSGVTMADAGDYTLCLTSDQNCGPICETVALTVNAGLVITDLTGGGDYCVGDSIVLSANNTVVGGITSVTYTWTLPDGSEFTDTTDPAGPFTLTIPNASLSDSGTYTLNLTSDAGCVSDPATIDVTVNENPVLDPIAGGGSYCMSANVTLTSSNTVGGLGNINYTWTLPDGSEVTGNVMNNEVIELIVGDLNDTNTGTYTLMVVTDLGCSSNTVSTEVSLNEMPTVIDVTPDTLICEDQPLTLNATNNSSVDVTYNWDGPNGYNATGSAGAGETFSETIDPINTFAPGDFILTVTTADGCVSNPDTVSVELSPMPVLDPISGGGFYCAGDTVVLSVVNTTPGIDSIYYTCITPDSVTTVVLLGGMDTFTIVIPNVDSTYNGFIFCSAESMDGCGSSLVSTEIIIQPTPVIIDMSSDSPYCAGDTATLTATNSSVGTGTITYTWTGPGGFEFTGTADFNGPFPVDISDISVDQAGEYCLNLVTDAGCESETQCIDVVVNPTPVLTPSTGGGDYCAGDTVTISTMNETPGIDTVFYTCTGPNGLEITGFVLGNDPIVLVLEDITADDSGTYTCVATTSEGCESDPVSVTITVNATPIIEEISSGDAYCEGETASLTATNNVADVGTVTYTWLNPDGSVLFTGTAGENGPFDASIPDITLDQAGNYCLILESEAGCGSDTMCVEVVVNPNPIISAFTGGGEFCEDDVTTLTADIELNGANSMDWSITGPNGFDESGTATSDETLTFDITVSSATEGTYTITLVSDEGCEADPQTVTIELIEVPIPVLEASLDLLCPGDELQLTVTNSDEYTGQVVEYSWFENGELITTTLDPSFIIMNPSGGDYSVGVTMDGCSESSASITIPAILEPIAVDDNYTMDYNTELNGNVISNDDDGDGTIEVTSNTEPSNGTLTINPDGSFTYTPDFNFVGDDSFQYTICSIECPDQCSTATVTIDVQIDELLIPNVITPNGDGDNDSFVIVGLIPDDFPDNQLQVFNRWGDEVYFAKPYRNDWQGTFKDEPLPNGTYFILLDLGTGDDPIAQFLTVVR